MSIQPVTFRYAWQYSNPYELFYAIPIPHLHKEGACNRPVKNTVLLSLRGQLLYPPLSAEGFPSCVARSPGPLDELLKRLR